MAKAVTRKQLRDLADVRDSIRRLPRADARRLAKKGLLRIVFSRDGFEHDELTTLGREALWRARGS